MNISKHSIQTVWANESCRSIRCESVRETGRDAIRYSFVQSWDNGIKGRSYFTATILFGLREIDCGNVNGYHGTTCDHSELVMQPIYCDSFREGYEQFTRLAREEENRDGTLSFANLPEPLPAY